MNGSECCCCNRLQFVDWIRNEPVVGTLLCCCCCCCCLCCCLESTNEAYLIFRGRWVGVPMCHIHLGVCEHFFVAGNNSIICGPHQCHPPHRCHCASFPATEQFRRIPQEKKKNQPWKSSVPKEISSGGNARKRMNPERITQDPVALYIKSGGCREKWFRRIWEIRKSS